MDTVMRAAPRGARNPFAPLAQLVLDLFKARPRTARPDALLDPADGRMMRDVGLGEHDWTPPPQERLYQGWLGTLG